MSVAIVRTDLSPLASSPIADGRMFEPELIVPIELLRDHAKINDVPTVTDRQLSQYRSTAIEQAERYTGLMIGKKQQVTETITLATNKGHDVRKSYKHTLQYPVADGIVYVYGPGIKPYDGTIHVTPGSTKLRLPNIFGALDFMPCCGPCGTLDNGLFKILYLAGYESESQVPSGIITGILQYVTWMINHPGDEFLSVRNSMSNRTGALDGTNNAALASGALELWRTYVDSAG